jgi:hypothetical protein
VFKSHRNQYWLVVWSMKFIFPFFLGIIPTDYFSEGLKPPTRWVCNPDITSRDSWPLYWWPVYEKKNVELVSELHGRSYVSTCLNLTSKSPP